MTERTNINQQLIKQTVIWLAITVPCCSRRPARLIGPRRGYFTDCGSPVRSSPGYRSPRHHPEIIKERMRPPMQQAQKSWDKPLLFAIFGGWAALHIIAGLDAVRFGWSQMPLWLEIVGALAVVMGIYVFHIVMRENSYASAVVKVDTERGHKVISTGPYAWVRHPMYAGAIFYFLGTALLLGSWCAFAIGIVLIAIIALRAVWEEEMLASELPGYADYARRVKYRLVPGVW